MVLNSVPDFDDRYLINDQYISHYTSSKTALEHILYSNKIKIGNLSNTDDPIENLKHTMKFIKEIQSETVPLELKKMEDKLIKIIASTKLCCFSKNEEHDPSIHVISLNKGYNKVRMWSQYAENHKGVCFIFNKEKIIDNVIKHLSELRTKYLLFFGEVEYTNDAIKQRSIFRLFESDLEHINPIDNFFLNNEKSFFRTKLLDYRDEQEFRIILLPFDNNSNDEIYIEIDNCINGIICGTSFHDIYLPIIQKYSNKYEIPVYKMKWTDGFPGFDKI